MKTKTTPTPPRVVEIHTGEDVVKVKSPLISRYGETPSRVRCLANGDGGPDVVHNWIDRWAFEPGRATRYDLLYGHRGRGEFIIGQYLDGEGRWMIVHDPGYTHINYVMDRLGVNEVDGVAVLKFLEFMGHAVGYPRATS
jgi:hypothetical protein